MLKKTMAQQIRDVFNEIGKNKDGEAVPVSAARIAEYLDVKDDSQRKNAMYCTLTDLRDRGEIFNVSRGVYQFKHINKKPFVRTVMWRILRSRKKVNAEDLMELAGASENYAKEWLRVLETRKIVKKMKGGSYRLVNDVVNEPVSSKRAERLRNWRKKKKEAMAALDRAVMAIDDAKKILEED